MSLTISYANRNSDKMNNVFFYNFELQDVALLVL